MQDLIDYCDRVRRRTMNVAAVVPADRIDWAPAPGAMTFGDLLRHMAVTSRLMFVEVAAGRPSLYTTHGRELGATRAAILALLEAWHAESMTILGGFTAEDWASRVRTPGGVSLPAWKWIRAMIEHEAHHRGQLYLMLRLCGIDTPAIFGMTSEEVRAAGRQRD